MSYMNKATIFIVRSPNKVLSQMYFALGFLLYSISQSCPTLYNPTDCSPPDSSVHRIFQARILEWVAISYFKGSSRPRDWTDVSYVSCTPDGWVGKNPWRKEWLPTPIFLPVSVLPMNTQDWSLLGWTAWISLQSKGLSRVFSNTTVQKHQFFSP